MSDPIVLHEAYRSGDVEALKTALGNPPDFPNTKESRGFEAPCLEYAIYHGPLSLIRRLLELGADPNYESMEGFPALIAALGSGRTDSCEILELLLDFGADIQQRGVNDYTPLHYAAARNDTEAIALLLSRGADPDARAQIDDFATPLEEAEILGHTQASARLRSASSNKRQDTGR